MSVPLINVWRGTIVESIHRGDLVVVDADDKIIYSLGNPQKITYFRSSAKAIQAVNVVKSGAYDKYKLTERELSLICSSHYAEDFHLQTVQSILDKIGLHKNNILGGIVASLNPEIALRQAASGHIIDERYSDCSGKQAGMLAVCQTKGYSLNNYLDPNHPCQQEILEDISTFCQIAKEEIIIGIDGCSAPVHALPLINMAIGFRNLSNPGKLACEDKAAANLVYKSMVTYPEMISGTAGFCSQLIKYSKGKLIGKIGAEGVYTIGVKERNIGIALKIESGSMAVIPPVIMRTLRELDILTRQELDDLQKYMEMDSLNDNGRLVGKITTAY
jgi:L-asparaginase II